MLDVYLSNFNHILLAEQEQPKTSLLVFI